MRGAKKRFGMVNGFTLVEILVTITIFGVGAYTLTLLFTSVQDAQRNAYYLSIATNAARSEVERLRTTSFSTVTDGQTFTSDLPNTLPSNRQGTIAVSVPSNAPYSKKVDVTVSYQVGSLPKSVTLTTFIDEPEGEEE